MSTVNSLVRGGSPTWHDARAAGAPWLLAETPGGVYERIGRELSRIDASVPGHMQRQEVARVIQQYGAAAVSELVRENASWSRLAQRVLPNVTDIRYWVVAGLKDMVRFESLDVSNPVEREMKIAIAQAEIAAAESRGLRPGQPSGYDWAWTRAMQVGLKEALKARAAAAARPSSDSTPRADQVARIAKSMSVTHASSGAQLPVRFNYGSERDRNFIRGTVSADGVLRFTVHASPNHRHLGGGGDMVRGMLHRLAQDKVPVRAIEAHWFPASIGPSDNFDAYRRARDAGDSPEVAVEKTFTGKVLRGAGYTIRSVVDEPGLGVFVDFQPPSKKK